MSHLANHQLKASAVPIVPLEQPMNNIKYPIYTQFVPTQQNTPLTQSVSMNGFQKSINGKDTSKKNNNN